MSAKKELNRPERSTSLFWKRRGVVNSVAAALLFSPLLFFEGCAPSSSKAKEVFVVALDAAPTQLDPRLATDAYSERIDHLLFSRLVRFDPDGRIVPDLAERWEIERPGAEAPSEPREREGEAPSGFAGGGGDASPLRSTRYTFHLRRGVRFHDGRPLTSDDVRYTFESVLDPALASPHRAKYEMIDRIETPDPATVRFILKRPYAPFPSEMTRGIVPRHVAEADPARFASRPVGSGPFSFVRYAPDDALELAASPDYFEGKPSIARLLFRIIPEDSVRLLELEKGNIDLVQNAFPPDALPRIQKNRRLKIVEAPSSTYTYLGFNLRDPVLKKRAVRQAIAFAIDREEIAEYLFKGLARPASGLLPSSHWASTDAVSSYPYDPGRAKRLLDEAGYPDPPGPAPRFRLVHKTSQNELARRVAEVFQSQLARVGIAMEIRGYEWGTFYADIKSGNFQTFTLSWVGVSDPDIYYQAFHSLSVPPAGANRGYYQNVRLDRLTEEGRETLDPGRRRSIYGEVQKIVSEDLPYVSLWHTENVAVMKPEVEGYRLYLDGDFYSLKEARKKS